MRFPDYFDHNSRFTILGGEKGKLVAYFHESDAINNIHLNIDHIFFVYVIEGTVKLKSTDGMTYVEAGNSAIVNNGPYIMSEALSGEHKRFKAYLFFLSKEILEQFYMDNPQENPNRIEATKNILLLQKTAAIALFVNSIELLFSEKTRGQDQLDKLIDLKSKELLHYFSMNNVSQEIHHMLNPFVEDKVKQLQKVMNHNFLDSSMSLEELAFLCNMSISSFKRTFAKVYQTSPAKWIKDKRLEYAMKLLGASSFNLSEIAYKSGFKNLTSFNKQFEKKHGLLPKLYLLNKK